MEFEFRAVTVLKMEHNKGDTKSKHLETKFTLEVSSNLDKEKYFDSEGLPSAGGSHALTGTLVQGLIGNIHHAHEKGYRDSAEHLRYIISELERGVFTVAQVGKGEF